VSKRAIVVGASSGIGRELALQLVKDGYCVGITGRRLHMLEEVKAIQPSSFVISSFDVSLDDNAKKMDQLVAQLGGLDLCIISSGTGEFNLKLEYETELRTLKVNINGFTEIADWCYEYFINKGNGHLAAITSIAGLRGNALAPAYNATKAFQINYLEGLRKRAYKFSRDMIITDIRPGFVKTEIAKGDGLFWVAPVKKAAKQIIRAIIKKREVVYITRRWKLIAFCLRWVPDFFYRRMGK
jgi:short-subunit dehydrogenase